MSRLSNRSTHTPYSTHIKGPELSRVFHYMWNHWVPWFHPWHETQRHINDFFWNIRWYLICVNPHRSRVLGSNHQNDSWIKVECFSDASICIGLIHFVLWSFTPSCTPSLYCPLSLSLSIYIYIYTYFCLIEVYENISLYIYKSILKLPLLILNLHNSLTIDFNCNFQLFCQIIYLIESVAHQR